MSKKAPKHVGDILDKLKKSTALGENLEQARIWERWPELAGARLAPHGQPRSVRDKTLYVDAESPVWANRFAYAKWDIIRRVNRLAGRELINEVFVALIAEEDTPPAQHDV
ncbi:MAG: hypothetical protein AMXMBFR84_15780 [Candidatus Hydrogenedentota bacterium]